MMQQPTFIQSPLGDYQNIHNIRRIEIEDNSTEGHAGVFQIGGGAGSDCVKVSVVAVALEKADELLYEGGARIIPAEL